MSCSSAGTDRFSVIASRSTTWSEVLSDLPCWSAGCVADVDDEKKEVRRSARLVVLCLRCCGRIGATCDGDRVRDSVDVLRLSGDEYSRLPSDNVGVVDVGSAARGTDRLGECSEALRSSSPVKGPTHCQSRKLGEAGGFDCEGPALPLPPSSPRPGGASIC